MRDHGAIFTINLNFLLDTLLFGVLLFITFYTHTHSLCTDLCERIGQKPFVAVLSRFRWSLADSPFACDSKTVLIFLEL